MKLKMRILAASYRASDVTIELFGRTEDGSSVTALYFGFKPYFDIVEPDEACMNSYRSEDEYEREEEKELWVDGKIKRVERIYIKSPWKVPSLREICQPKFKVLAADIPFHHRFIYDMDLGSCVEIEGEIDPMDKTKFTTDYVVRTKNISNVPEFNPPLKVLSFDIENAITPEEKKKYGRILVIGYSIFDGKQWEKGALRGKENEILENFVRLINEKDPDILTGYNSDGYDIPVIEERMNNYGIPFAIGRDFEEPRRVQNQYWRLHGRIILDTWWAVKKVLKPKHETLNYVAMKMLGEGKDNINRLKIEEEWNNRPDEVTAYCIKDADLTLKILLKLRIIDRNLFMSTVTKLPLDDVTNGGTSNYVDSLLIRKADRESIGVPMTNRSLKEAPITGGYVHSIGAGIYDNVIVLDFKSMYPSMMMKYNICFTTLDPKGEIVAPNNIRFLSKQQKEGLIPGLLRDLMEERDKIKKRMKVVSEEERVYLDGVQGAIKILMNTFYGVMASSFYRFTNIEIGSAITAYARNTITSLIESLEHENYRVIYGDTDSIFIESQSKSTEDAVKVGNSLSDRLSKEQGVILEFEKVMDPFFSHGAKKRYAGRIVYPETQKGEILIRGYEVRRTDSFDLQSEALSKVFEFIMNRDVDGAINYRNELLNLVKKGDESIDISKLVISRSVKKFGEHGEYKDEKSLANVRIAKKLIERGETFIPGMKVSWIVTNSKKKPQEVEPFIDGAPFTGRPDWDYYARRIEETLNRVLEGLEEDYGKVIPFSQSKLMEFSSESVKSIKNEDKTPKQQSTLFEF